MTPTLSSRIWTVLKTTPLFWAVFGFWLSWWYAQFIVTVAWNAIELIIAQHILLKGVYATSVDYQNALTWRPLVPTGLVTLCRVFTSDPMTIYRFLCGAALATMVASLFYTAKKLWSLTAGHAAAVLALACPAITHYLINHVHSYSHIGTMIVLGPTLLLALQTLNPLNERPLPMAAYVALGLLWALCYLSRAELLLFAALHVVALAVYHLYRKFRFARLAAMVAVFVSIFIAYNIYADHVVTRDGIVVRKTIYTMYISQGWVDPAPGAGADIEGDGYRYAIRLYGTPESNGESLVRAIEHNLPAFLRRVKLNTLHFYEQYGSRNFYSLPLAVLTLGAFAIFIATLKAQPFGQQLPLWFLVSLFFASHFILIFHIDARYLTINIPPLILLAAYGVDRVHRLRPSATRSAGLVFCLIATAFASEAQFSVFYHHRPRNEISIPAMQALGSHFRHVAAHRLLRTGNQEPHIRVDFPDHAPLYPEDQFLLAYFSKTAWVNGGAGGTFPRGKFYSYRDSPIDYVYLPAEKISNPESTRGLSMISECDVPVIGHYYLYRTN